MASTPMASTAAPPAKKTGGERAKPAGSVQCNRYRAVDYFDGGGTKVTGSIRR